MRKPNPPQPPRRVAVKKPRNKKAHLYNSEDAKLRITLLVLSVGFNIIVGIFFFKTLMKFGEVYPNSSFLSKLSDAFLSLRMLSWGVFTMILHTILAAVISLVSKNDARPVFGMLSFLCFISLFLMIPSIWITIGINIFYTITCIRWVIVDLNRK